MNPLPTLSAFLVVTRAIEDLFNAVPALADGDIERSRARRVAQESERALRIYPQNADGQAAAVRGGFHSWAFEVSVECMARAPLSGPNKGDAEAAVSELLHAVWQRMAPAQIPGVQHLLKRPRIAWEHVEADRPLACATLTFGVDLSTHNRSLQLWS